MKAVNENVMAAHHRKALAEISEDIAALQSDIERLKGIRDGLIHFYGGDTPVEELLPSSSLPDRSAVRTSGSRNGGGRSVATEPATARAGGGPGRQPSAEYVKLMSAARTCPEPFTAASLHVATGIEKKFCANKLWKWQQKGFLEKVGTGEFKRTGTFPASAEAE